VAVLSRHFAPTAGGAEAYAYRLVECLADRYAFTICAQSFGPPIEGVVYRPISAPPWMPRWINQWHFSRATQQACGGMDIVHSHENAAHGQIHTVHVQTVRSNLFGPLAKRTPWINALKVATSPRLMFYLWIERRRITSAAKQVVFASEALKADTIAIWPELAAELKPGALSVIRPGTFAPPLPATSQAWLRRKATSRANALRDLTALKNADPQAPWLLFAANDWAKKGLGVILHAFPDLPPNAQLLIAGKTEQQARFAAQLAAPNLAKRIHVLGPLQNLAALYPACDLLLHPTLQDAYPMVVLEAFGHGLPVITTQAPYNGLAAELAGQEEALLLCTPGDADALAQAVQTALFDASATQARATQAHKFAQAHRWEAIAQEYAACYDAVLNP
jgi:UDP-glucose:(heptosyl)LPS alpha-1,3-glucosyltransferase